MCRFMGYDIFQILLIHTKGQVNLRFDDTENKGRFHVLALIDIIAKQYRCSDLFFYAGIADHCINKQRSHSKGPCRRQYGNPYLQWIYAVSRCGCQRLTNHWVYGAVNNRYARVNGRQRIRHNAWAYCFLARNQTQRAFNGKRANKPDSYNAPEYHRNPFGRFFEKQSQKQHGQNNEACRYAHIDYSKEYL